MVDIYQAAEVELIADQRVTLFLTIYRKNSARRAMHTRAYKAARIAASDFLL